MLVLLTLLKKYAPKRLKLHSIQMPLAETGKPCYLHWVNRLRPNLKKINRTISRYFSKVLHLWRTLLWSISQIWCIKSKILDQRGESYQLKISCICYARICQNLTAVQSCCL